MPIPTPIIPGVVLGNTPAEVYRFLGNDPKVRQIELTDMSFMNSDSAARTVTVHIIPPGGSASLANTKFKTVSVLPSSEGTPPPSFDMSEVMLPGYSIQAFADAGAVVVIRANGVTYP